MDSIGLHSQPVENWENHDTPQQIPLKELRPVAELG
jgi:hypothetical protein